MKKISVTSIALIFFLYTVCYFVFTLSTFAQNQTSSKVNSIDYSLAWPGVLPDNKMYKLKVLRNKIIYRMILNPVKKVEFDLLMADKTIYASKLLIDKGKIVLAKETALKGENYYSILVQDYNHVLLKGKKIPSLLDRKITLAAAKHQETFKEMENAVSGEDKKTFQIVDNFSKINYDFIVGLRKPKK